MKKNIEEYKAREILLFYSNVLRDYGNITKEVKKCSLFLVDEVINTDLNKKDLEYWEKIKIEINKY